MDKKIFLVMAAFFWILSCSKSSYEVKISQAQIQTVIAQKFPIQKQVLIANLNLHSPAVYFQGNALGLRLQYTAHVLTKTLTGTGDFRGQVKYDGNRGLFYLTQLQLIDVTISEASFINTEQLKTSLALALLFRRLLCLFGLRSEAPLQADFVDDSLQEALKLFASLPLKEVGRESLSPLPVEAGKEEILRLLRTQSDLELFG